MNKIGQNFTYEQIHSGQKRAYGDSYCEWEIESSLSIKDVYALCRARVHTGLSENEWKILNREERSMNNHFKNYHKFEHVEGNKYLYIIIHPYTG